MAKRTVFLVSNEQNLYYKELILDFTWNKGMSYSQKQKNVEALHREAKKNGYDNLLEVSTKSTLPLGKSLSAFNLKLSSNGLSIPVESLYQGSKVFEFGGPYTDIYYKNGFDAKKDDRLQNSGELVGFFYKGTDWSLEPGTSFYDWLYITTLYSNPNLYNQLDYEGFTDIEFNHLKQMSCQARSCAIFISLYKAGQLESALESKSLFLKFLNKTYGLDINGIIADVDTSSLETEDNYLILESVNKVADNKIPDNDTLEKQIFSLLSEKALTASDICSKLNLNWKTRQMVEYLKRLTSIEVIRNSKIHKYILKDAKGTQVTIDLS